MHRHFSKRDSFLVQRSPAHPGYPEGRPDLYADQPVLLSPPEATGEILFILILFRKKKVWREGRVIAPGCWGSFSYSAEEGRLLGFETSWKPFPLL